MTAPHRKVEAIMKYQLQVTSTSYLILSPRNAARLVLVTPCSRESVPAIIRLAEKPACAPA